MKHTNDTACIIDQDFLHWRSQQPASPEPTPSPEQWLRKIDAVGYGLNKKVTLAVLECLSEVDIKPLTIVLQAYADAVSKPLRERISELDKELAEEKRRSDALLNLGRGEGNSDATR